MTSSKRAREGRERDSGASTKGALRESEQRARRTLESLKTMEAIVVRGPALLFLWRVEPGVWPVEFVSDNIKDVLGYTPEDFTSGRISWPGITHPDDAQRLEAEVGHVIEAGRREWSQEYRVFALSGEVRWFRDWNRSLTDEAGRITHIQALTIDITENKQAEEARECLLREVQAERDRIAALVASMQDEVWFADPQQRFMLANPPALKHFGLMSDGPVDVETLAASLEVLRPDGSPRPVEEAPPLRALRGEIITNQEEIVRTPATGELRHRQVNATPVKDKEGRIIGSVSVVRDITDRIKSGDELRESEERFRLSLANAPVIVAMQDENLVYTRAYNTRTWRPEEVVGKTDADLFAPEDIPGMLEVKRKVLETGEVARRRCWLTSNGQRVFLDCYYEPIRDSAGRIAGVGVAAVNLTEQQKAEDALRAANADLNSFNELMVGRELRMIELKKEIDRLCRQFGLPTRYGYEND